MSGPCTNLYPTYPNNLRYVLKDNSRPPLRPGREFWDSGREVHWSLLDEGQRPVFVYHGNETNRVSGTRRGPSYPHPFPDTSSPVSGVLTGTETWVGVPRWYPVPSVSVGDTLLASVASVFGKGAPDGTLIRAGRGKYPVS